MTNLFNIKRGSAAFGQSGVRRVGKTLLTSVLFSGLLLVLLGILLFLSRHEPDPTPDQVGLLQPTATAPTHYQS